MYAQRVGIHCALLSVVVVLGKGHIMACHVAGHIVGVTPRHYDIAVHLAVALSGAAKYYILHVVY